MYPKQSYHANQTGEGGVILIAPIKFRYSDKPLGWYRHVFHEIQAVVVCMVERGISIPSAQKACVMVEFPEAPDEFTHLFFHSMYKFRVVYSFGYYVRGI